MSGPELDFGLFLQNLMHFGLEYFRRYYGQYRGNVTSNKDPEKRGRIQAYVPAVGQTQKTVPDVWIEAAITGSGKNRGTFWPPEVGDSVWISFMNGNPNEPNVYFGGWFGTSDLPKDFEYSSGGYPERRGFITRAGHQLKFNDEPGKESVRLAWHKPSSTPSDRSESASRDSGNWSFLGFEKDGDVQLVNKNGSMVYLDATNKQVKVVDENGNSIMMGPSGIQVVDKNGNFVNLNATGISGVTNANIALNCGGPFGIQAGGVNVTAPVVAITAPQVTLGSPAAIPLVKHTPWIPLWSAIAGVAEGLGKAGTNSPTTPVLLGMLAPFFEVFAKMAQMYPSLTTLLVRAT